MVVIVTTKNYGNHHTTKKTNEQTTHQPNEPQVFRAIKLSNKVLVDGYSCEQIPFECRVLY